MGIRDAFLSNVFINFILSVYREQKVKDLIFLAVSQQYVGKVLYEVPTHHSADPPQIDLQSPLLTSIQGSHMHRHTGMSQRRLIQHLGTPAQKVTSISAIRTLILSFRAPNSLFC